MSDEDLLSEDLYLCFVQLDAEHCISQELL